MSPPLLEVDDLARSYRGGDGHVVHAVDGVSFRIGAGETLGLVGESGSGKSTIGRLVLRLEQADRGRIRFDGQEIGALRGEALRQLRPRLQMVFQDPFASLNPRRRVGDSVAAGLRAHGLAPDAAALREQVAALFRRVGLDPGHLDRHPHEFSGGQRQRIGIARALALKPRLIVADEPITALDVSIQAQIINLFLELQQDSGLSYLFIAHDLGMVRHLSHRVAVMLRGRIVETGPTAAVFEDARHPYTRALLSAMPLPDPDLEAARQRLTYTAAPFAPDAALREVTPGHWVLG
ncbi:ABC transporter ATP-binding protein [Roseomonas sp. 18066]|uniref:ABC transporter ATP-binding protein n=1 Tax=Roseomonas sp. 18066 TaxID=2681412 RepID=UPI0013588746|nr:ATP-binding cassette domain-containing protein [Roseomonas sp. 18066]